MKRYASLWAKSLSCVLLLAGLLATMLCGLGLSYGAVYGAYSGRTFWTSDLSAQAVMGQLHMMPDNVTEYFRLQYELAQGGRATAEQARFLDMMEQIFDPTRSNLRARYTRMVSPDAPPWRAELGVAAPGASYSSDAQTLDARQQAQIQVCDTLYSSDTETLELGIDRDLPAHDLIRSQYELFDALAHAKGSLTAGLTGGVIVLLVCLIHLLTACGHRPGQAECVLRWCDRVPYLVVLCVLAIPGSFGAACLIETSYMHEWQDFCVFLVLGIVLLSVPAFLLLMTTVARCKAHQFWRTTLTYHGYAALRRAAGRARQYADGRIRKPQASADAAEPAPVEDCAAQPQARALALLGAHAKSFRLEDSAFARAGHGAAGLLRRLTVWLRACLNGLRTGFSQLSLTWQGVLVGAAMLGLYLFIVLTGGIQVEPFLLLLLLSALVLFGLVRLLGQMAALQQGAQRMADGDLDYKIPTEPLHGAFRAHAARLNAISQGMAVAVEHRLRSEKLKTELLTNVSHDIKTPLTSIINYVDLLQKTDLQPAEARVYAAVLERQSLRLKKLLEDLIEASKASTGNINVELAPTDAAELLRQAAGEYSERFQQNGLSPVIRIGTADCTITADGRLLWRVFDNLLGNIVKYAMPGTRVYLDLSPAGAHTCISLKNISREELNIDTEELMERFVRGDVSRATEGSGLGLSIARSLTECMGGLFDLSIDGDLFKVTLRFARPGADHD